jgi:hypothetical protein
MSAVLLAMFNQYKIAERMRVELVRDGFPTDRVELTASCEPRPWIIATVALCLLFAAYPVDKQEFRGTGTSDSSLQHTENVPNETGLPREAHTPPRVSAVITDYFDTSLAELHLPRRGSGYTQLEDYDSDWWVLENGTTVDIASCLARIACGLYDTDVRDYWRPE